jgi:hypothetical protein
MTKEHTRHGPAVYCLGMNQQTIRDLETETVRSPSSVLSTPPGKSEYAREMGLVIGWDEGKDATLSFVECSGGLSAGRSFHGRPMATSNRKIRGA